MTARILRGVLIGLDAWVAITAVAGGIELVTQGSTRFPASWLQGTPFSDYTVPGLMLGLLVGGCAAIATVATIRSRSAGAAASGIAGLVTAGWICGEVLLLNQPRPTWIELAYFVIGMAIVILSVSTRERRGQDVLGVS